MGALNNGNLVAAQKEQKFGPYYWHPFPNERWTPAELPSVTNPFLNLCLLDF